MTKLEQLKKQVKNGKSINQQVRDLRATRGWSQRELAIKMGVPQSTIVRIESGEMTVSSRSLEKLGEAFELSVGFYDGTSTHKELLEIKQKYKYLLELLEEIVNLNKKYYV